MFIYSGVHILIPVIGLIVNVIIQIISFRLISKIGLLKSIFLGFGAGVIFVILGEFYIVRSAQILSIDFIAILIVNMIIYSSLCYCYFNFITLGETARRIRILREIYESDNGLTMQEILERYNAKEIIARRLERLIKNKQILFKEGKYYVGTPLILIMSEIIVIMKLMLFNKKSEFEKQK